ncbi:MAG: PIN domain-containing protein [Gammaproteobacteria bacterium]|nr:PIN domain-containing protein [Gammaproteobacteria bacterium]
MLYLFRFAVILVFAVSGYFIGQGLGTPAEGALAGLAVGAVAVVIELVLGKVPMGSIAGGVAGLALGLIAAKLLLVPFRGMFPEPGIYAPVLGAVLGYGGLLLGMKKGSALTAQSILGTVKGQRGGEATKKLLDTSVIIDGRIADVCETGFIEGAFIVPQFILQELQHIADSPDSLKRARGRRGLDVLHRMQKMADLNVEVVEQDFPKIKEVDSKLVALAQSINAKVITNDFNLNKVAELQGVPVLNVNELANAIKPVVLPGETLKAFIIKEGKEHNQGVAYLEDGTMIVVDNGRKLIGKNVEVSVTSVLQTTAGRMIFTKPKDEYEREEARAGK